MSATKERMNLDGSDIDGALALVGARDPGTTDHLLALEAAIGHPLPAETRALVRAAPTLFHPDAEHPAIPVPGPFDAFALGLPDVDAFLDAIQTRHLARYAACVHFVGLVPLGVRLYYGDFLYLLGCVDEYADGVGGVMYYDERELGTWSPTCSAMLHRAAEAFFEQCDEQRDGLDEEELAEFELDRDDLRDCFVLDVEPARPPPGEASDARTEAWTPVWTKNMHAAQARWWMPWFLTGNLPTHVLDSLPRRAVWEAEKHAVATRYGDAMYWLLAHALLGNEAELEDCLARTEPHAGRFVQAVREAAPALLERFAEHREALYAAANA